MTSREPVGPYMTGVTQHGSDLHGAATRLTRAFRDLMAEMEVALQLEARLSDAHAKCVASKFKHEERLRAAESEVRRMVGDFPSGSRVRVAALRPQPPDKVLQYYVDARRRSGLGAVLRGADHLRPLLYVMIDGDSRPGVYFADELDHASTEGGAL